MNRNTIESARDKALWRLARLAEIEQNTITFRASFYVFKQRRRLERMVAAFNARLLH